MMSKLTVTTFGGLALFREGASPGPAAGQRRPLAVLAMLAAAGDVGVSRDKLTAVLWPDADVERGRRALAQTVYSLRRAAGDPDLFSGVADIRLNREAIDVDAIAFDDAIREGRLDDAAALYKGEFCDGFAVPGAPEFDRWLDNERTRYASRCADALRRLVRAAQSENDAEKEIAWSRRLVEIDPVDSASTLLLIDALAKAGDVATAMRCASVHEALVRDQLDMPVSATIRERLESLKSLKPARLPMTSVEGSAPATKTAAPAEFPYPGPVENLEQRRGPAGRSLRTAGVAVVVAILLVSAAVTVVRRQNPPTPAEAAVLLKRDVVAIMPFAVESQDPSLAFLGEGSASLMARILSGEGGPRAVDPGAVLAVLDSLRLPPRSAPPSAVASHAREVSRRLGAAQALVGRISGNADSVAIGATMLDVATGAQRAAAEVRGPADSLASLVETLATRLIAQTTIGGERATAFSGARLPVLRSYLRAEAAYHADSYAAAAAGYRQALAQDSSFAPAALGLALAADRMNSAEQHDHGLALAWAAREKLSERDRSFLVALAGPRYPEPSPMREQLSAWENVVALNPERSSAWTELGERLLSDGSLVGIVNPDDRASAAFRRALALDPADPRPRRYLLQIAAKTGDVGTIDRLLRADDLRTMGGEIAGYLTWRVAIARGDTAGLRRIRERFPSLGDASLRAIAMASQYEGVASQDGAHALRLLHARAALGADQLDVLLAQHSLALNQQRYRLAFELTERLQEVQPGTRSHLRLRVLDALYSGGDSLAAERAVSDLEGAIRPAPADTHSAAVRLADICVLAQWRAAPWRRSARMTNAEKQSLRGMITELRTAALPTGTVSLSASPRACAEIAEAMLAVRERSGNARARVAGLDDMMLAGPAAGDATAWASLATARLYDLLGDRQRALAVVRQRPFMKGWPRYLGASLVEEARIAKASGDEKGHALALEHYEALKSGIAR